MLISMIGALLLLGCTEKLPLNPIYGNDADWAPVISLNNNDYRRVEYTLNRPPRKELLRNIEYYTIQVLPKNASTFFTIDSLNYFLPSYIFPYNQYPRVSEPKLDYNAEYTLRAAVTYRTGAVQLSNEIKFTTPAERGKILRTIPSPRQTFPSFFYNGRYIVFYNGKITILGENKIIQIDTANGQATTLKDNLYFFNTNAMGMTSCADTLFIFTSSAGYSAYSKYAIMRLYLKTLKLDTLITFETSGNVLQWVLGHNSELYLFWGLNNGRQQVSVLNSQTGQTLHTYPDVPVSLQGSLYPFVFCSDGAKIWTTTNEYFNNMIVNIDPLSLKSLKEYHNPTFSPNGLMWDGKNFWTVDLQYNTLVKLQLEGM